MASCVRQRAINKKTKAWAKAPPLHITQKWVVKEKEPILASVNMADRADDSSTPPKCRPLTRSMTRAKARRLWTLVRFRNLDEVLIVSDNNDDEASIMQSAGGSASPRTLSSPYLH